MYSALHEIIIEKAKNKFRTAIIDESGVELTYDDLLENSAVWRDFILSHGVSPGERVGISVERNALLPCLLLAISRAGCTWVPLDPAYPAQWREFVIRDADIKLVLHDDSLIEDNFLQNVNYVNTLTVNTRTLPQRFPSRAVAPSDICYVIYTSGSTGVPKGVLIKHENVVNFIEWALEVYTAEDLQRVVCCTSICFDLSLFEIFATLSAGGTCYIVRNALSILSLPKNYRPTLINTVPAAMREILRHDALPETDPLIINLAGEALSGELVSALYHHPNVKHVVNLYGPSETTTYSTWDIVPRNEQIPTIGKPIKETQIYLLDENLKPVASDDSGEIFIAGKGVSAGYINRPEITAERFVTLQAPDGSSVKAYKTGDIGRWLEDGRLAYEGRADDQVKVRGYRIELQHIEDTLLRFEEIADAVVVAAFPGKDNVALVAWLVQNHQQIVSTDKIRKYLKEQLPEYMVPARFFIVEAFPQLPNGKINRKALRSQSEECLVQSIQNSASSFDILDNENFLLSLFSQITAEPTLTRDSNIFSLGVNSLSILKITAEIKKRFGLLISPSVIKNNPSVSELLEYISISGQAQQNTIREFALTESQQQMYCLSQITGHDPANNVCFSLTLASDTSENDIKFIADTLYHSADLMRSRIPTGESWQNMVVNPPINVIRGHFSDSELQAIVYKVSQEEIDPSISKLWKVTAIFNQNSAPIAVFVFHHLLIDDESLHFIFHTINNALQRTHCEPVSIPTTLIDCDKHIEHQNRLWWLSSLDKMKTTSSFSWPIDDGLDLYDTHALHSSYSISNQHYNKIIAICQKKKATLYELLLSALRPVLQNGGGSKGFTLGTIVSNRDVLAMHTQPGYFGSLMPIILPALGAHSWDVNIETVKRCVRETGKHAFVSANWLKDELRSRISPPIAMAVMFGCIQKFSNRIEQQEMRIDEINVGHSHPLLNFQARFDENNLHLFLDGRTNIFTQVELDHIIQQWVNSLETIAHSYSTEGELI